MPGLLNYLYRNDVSRQLCAMLSFMPSFSFVQALPEAESAAVMAEVLVTARRKKESLQSVPLAVSAFTAVDLELQ